MSCAKENTPLNRTPHSKHNNASFGKQPLGDDFFTDSIIDTSKIPSPSPNKLTASRSRRANGWNRPYQPLKPALSTTRRRPSSSESDIPVPSSSRLQVKNVNRRKSPSPLRKPGLSTPPQNSDGFELTSPSSDASSPPKGLDDTYRRIADEEDLVATEAEDSEDDNSVIQANPQTENLTNPATGTSAPLSPPKSQSSRATTPTQEYANAVKDETVDGKMESLSEASGMSFLAQMTDQNLAAKLTPHTINRAKDKARLAKVLNASEPISFGLKLDQNGIASNRPSPGSASGLRKPIAFANARNQKPPDLSEAFRANRKPRPFASGRLDMYRRSQDMPKQDSPRTRPIAFANARRKTSSSSLNSIEQPAQQIAPEIDDEPVPDHLKDKLIAFSNARAARSLQNILSGRYRQSQNRSSEALTGNQLQEANMVPTPLTSANLQKQEEQLPPRPPSVDTHHSEPTLQSMKWTAEQDLKARFFNHIKNRRNTIGELDEVKDDITDDASSNIDWAAAAADDKPVAHKPTIPAPAEDQTLELSLSPARRHLDKAKGWENDFTGTSFQISNSPPVRARSTTIDQNREREIQDLAKQGVTTNRLDEIGKKDPRELARKSSRTFSIGPEREPEEVPIPSIEYSDGEPIPDTPVLVYRASQNSLSKSESDDKETLSRPGASRQTSHDTLQRLARARSTTPRPSPTPELVSAQIKNDVLPETEKRTSSAGSSRPSVSDAASDEAIKPHNEEPAIIAETPKITGAWTDTILPDTVKTIRQTQKAPKYTQTPHIHAGGWIDTPLANSRRTTSAMAPEVIEEVDELEDQATSSQPAAVESARESEQPSAEKSADLPVIVTKPEMPPSALSDLIEKQKAKKRLPSQDITTAARGENDTLNLGDATLQSIEDLLSLDENDMTTLIRLGAEHEAFDELAERPDAAGNGDLIGTQAEAEVLERLSSKLERLRTNIHDARRGISKLEHQVNKPEPVTRSELTQPTKTPMILPGVSKTCTTCGIATDPAHTHTYTPPSYFPSAILNIRIPIPLLFYPRSRTTSTSSSSSSFSRLPPTLAKVLSYLPKPTPLGILTLILWTWFVTEHTLCEMYCHPTHASYYTWPARTEPVFPYVLPTMLVRWSKIEYWGPWLLGPFWVVLVGVFRFLGRVVGLRSGFVDDRVSGLGRMESRISSVPTTSLDTAYHAPDMTNYAYSDVSQAMSTAAASGLAYALGNMFAGASKLVLGHPTSSGMSGGRDVRETTFASTDGGGDDDMSMMNDEFL